MGLLSKKISGCVFYGILDTGYVKPEFLYDKCQSIVDAHVNIVQLRAKLEDAPTRRNIAFELLPIFKKREDIFFIINDDIELAAEICSIIPNAGLHIGQDDGSPKDARAEIGEGRVLGLSTHSESQAAAAESLKGVLDYFAVGPVYATNTKPGRSAVGLELVSKVAESRPSLPWFCIGGVNMRTARAVWNAGGRRIVAVSDVLLAENTTIAIESLRNEFLGAIPPYKNKGGKKYAHG